VHMNPEGNLIMAKGCLAALGVDAAQRADLEKQWLQQPDSAFVSTGNFDPRPRIGITLGQFRAIQKLAEKQGTDFGQYNLTLWLRTMAEVIPRHADDQVIDAEKLKKETTALFVEKLNALTSKP
jgi:hypothetical protein